MAELLLVSNLPLLSLKIQMNDKNYEIISFIWCKEKKILVRNAITNFNIERLVVLFVLSAAVFLFRTGRKFYRVLEALLDTRSHRELPKSESTAYYK